MLGRTLFRAGRLRNLPAPGAVLSHAFWQREFGGDPGALGRTISLDGHSIAGDRRHSALVLRRRGGQPVRRRACRCAPTG